MEPTEAEIQILENIHRNARTLHQRDIAYRAGLSLGMTNAILKRLARKGWLSIRKVNNRNIRYLATAAGLEKIAQRSYRYLRRTVSDIVRYRDAIGSIIDTAIEHGARGVELRGASSLDFIVEHLCAKRSIGYQVAAGGAIGPAPPGWFVLYSETLGRPDHREKEGRMTAYLQEVLVRVDHAPGGTA